MDFPQRKRIRMQNYDYAQGGAYFCTICVHKAHRHKALLAHVEDDQLILNRFGRVVERCWHEIPDHRDNVTLDEFCVMPNHVHLVVFLEAPCQISTASTSPRWPSAGSLGTVMGSFKAAATRAISELRGESTLVWQPRFYDHIIRSERELLAIRRYIENNPANWQNDRCHPEHPDFELAWQNIAPHDDFVGQ